MIFIRTIGALLLIAGMTGCGGSGSSAPASAPATPPVATPASTPADDLVVFIADADVDVTFELYIGSLGATGVATKLNAALTLGGNVTDFIVSPDGTQVFYRADQDSDEVFELYRVSIDTPGVSTRINGRLATGGDVYPDFAVTPDGTQVVYRADEDANSLDELFLVNLDTPGFSANLSGFMTSGGDVVPGFLLTPEGASVVYRADEKTNGVYELFLVDLALPGVSYKLSDALVAFGDVTAGFLVTADGSQVVYLADQEVDRVTELFVVSLALPGSSSKLNPALVSGGNVMTGFVFNDTGTQVAYSADQDFNNVFELYVVNLSMPGVTTKVNRNPASGGDVTAGGFQFSPSGDAMAYVADEDFNDVTEFYLVELTSPAVSIKLNPPLIGNGDLTIGFAFTLDGTDLVYVADQDVDGVLELYHVSRDLPGMSVKLNSALPLGGNVGTDFEMTADGDGLVYLADQDLNEVFELYTVDFNAPGVAMKVNQGLTAGGDVIDFALIPGS